MKLAKHFIICCCISLMLTGTISKSEASSILEDTRDWCGHHKKSLIAVGTVVTVGVGVAVYYLYPSPSSDPNEGSFCVRTPLVDQPLCVTPSLSYTSDAISLLEYNTRLVVSGIIDKLPNNHESVLECVRKYLCQYCGWVSKDDLGCGKSWNHLNQTIMECTERSDL